MKRKSILLSLLLLSQLAVPARTMADDPAAEFHKEYGQAAARLENAYLRVRVVRTETRNDARNKLLWQQSFSFERRDASVLLMHTALKSNSAKWALGESGAFGGTAEKYFNLIRRAGDANYTIKWFGPFPDMWQSLPVTCGPLFAPFDVTTSNFKDFLAQPDVTTSRIVADKLDGAEAIRVDAAQKLPDGQVSYCQTYLLPRVWVIVGYKVTIKKPDEPDSHGIVLEGRVEYSDLNAIPKVQKVHTWQVADDGSGNKVRERTFDVSKFEFIDVASDQFRIDRFGLKEPASPITPAAK